MKIKTNVRAGGIKVNHNEAQARAGLKVRTGVRAGGIKINHNDVQMHGAGRKA